MNFQEKIIEVQAGPLSAAKIDILQVNLGYRCNMACKHCHVKAGPDRPEVMDLETITELLGVLRRSEIRTLDITGGAPELNPHFRHLVSEAAETGCHVIVRSNLTIFYEEGMGDLYDFYGGAGVEIIASLPHYSESGVERVRGHETFRKSISVLKNLNGRGYGMDSTPLRLNLVYNPQGAFLPPSQSGLENEYRRELSQRFGISFNRLFTFANMPVGRFRDFLVRTGTLEKYSGQLKNAFNPATLGGLMCRHLINVGWDGSLYDCDFNQMTGLKVHADCPSHIRDFDESVLSERKISVDDHCFGCTAGQGST